MKKLLIALCLISTAYAADELKVDVKIGYSMNGAVISSVKSVNITVSNAAVSQPIQTISTNWTAYYFGDVTSNCVIQVSNLSSGNNLLRLATAASTNVFARVKPGETWIWRTETGSLLGSAQTNTLPSQEDNISE